MAFDACRCLISSTFGLSLRKKHPRTIDIMDATVNPSMFQKQDTINVIDIDLSGVDPLEAIEWADTETAGIDEYT